MEKTNVKPKLTDIIPGYGAINYIWRTTCYVFDEKPSVGKHITVGVLNLAQVLYNSVVGVEVLNLLERKQTLTQKILENLL